MTIEMDGLPRPPKIGPCDQCGAMTDAYVGHDCPDVEFLCDACTNKMMGEGWAKGQWLRKQH
jgi:hypothetical protein